MYSRWYPRAAVSVRSGSGSLHAATDSFPIHRIQIVEKNEKIMITEIALLSIKEKEKGAFENQFKLAQNIISSMEGYLEHELLKCIETENRYLLRVKWENLEAHTEGFRKHEKYTAWKQLLHHFYDPFPIVEHYIKIY